MTWVEIAVLAISELFVVDQIQGSLPSLIAKIHEFLLNVTGPAEMRSLLHKSLHTDSANYGELRGGQVHAITWPNSNKIAVCGYY